MKDLVLALMGCRHCEWCVDATKKPSTRWERWFRLDIAMRTDSRPWHERAAMALSTLNTEYLPIWKLGRQWHDHVHVHRSGS